MIRLLRAGLFRKWRKTRRAANTGGIGTEDGPFNAGIEAAVRAELETMLMAPIFVQSGRCKRFLTYVVEQALRGNSSQLKERIIGVTVLSALTITTPAMTQLSASPRTRSGNE